jgi:hypothetical protein
VAGALPNIWNLPHRNPHFTGREGLIKQLHRNLTAGTATALTQTAAIHGLGGVGKTQLAIEYAYRFKDDYDMGWWIWAFGGSGRLLPVFRRLDHLLHAHV